MSRRNREERAFNPDAKQTRREQARRERHAAKEALSQIDPEEVVVPVMHHTLVHEPPPPKDPGRLRHWKDRSWKRRTARRHARNVALRRLAIEE